MPGLRNLMVPITGDVPAVNNAFGVQLVDWHLHRVYVGPQMRRHQRQPQMTQITQIRVRSAGPCPRQRARCSLRTCDSTTRDSIPRGYLRRYVALR